MAASWGASDSSIHGSQGEARRLRRVRVGKIWIHALTFDQAIDEIERLVEKGQGGSVFTPNVDHVVQVEHNAAFLAAYDAASLCLVDGQPLLWTSRLLGSPLPEKISGSDLIVPLMRRAEQKKWRVYLLGGPPGVAEMAKAELRRQFKVDIVGVDAPRVSPDGKPSDAGVIERIVLTKPHIVLAAFGAPKQELLIHNASQSLKPAVAIGVGAGFDFIAGRIHRAPKWMSDNGLEWVFRLAQEPRRLAKRYLRDDPEFLAILLRMLRLPKAERVRFDP